MTVNEFAKYVDSDNGGRILLKDNAPLFATKLVALYEAAKEEIPYNERDITTYYSKNIYEFMAGVFVSPDYRQQLEDKQEGFMDRFRKMLRDLLGLFYTETSGQTLKYNDEIFETIKDLLRTEKELNPENKGITLEGTPSFTQVQATDDVTIPEVESERPEPTRIDMSKFTSGGEGYDSRFRYPEIKKC